MMDFIDRDLFRKYLDLNFEVIQEEFKEDPHSQLVPKLMICILNDKGGWDLEIAVFEEFGEQRYEIIGGLGVKYGQAQRQVVAAYLITEVWVSQQSPEERAAHPENRVPPSEDPDRQEAVMVCGMTLRQAQDGTLKLHCEGAIAMIKRDGELVRLERKGEGVTKFESPLLNQFFRYFGMAYFLAGKT